MTTVKLLNKNDVIATHKVDVNQVLVIKAQPHVNYQIIDDATGFAPQNIITKREGNDLKIYFDDGDQSEDVVIKDYYADDEITSMVIGQHENGQFYAYIPESGETFDAISQLAQEVFTPQALGGEELSSAFWGLNPGWIAGGTGVVLGLMSTLLSSSVQHTETQHQAPQDLSADAPILTKGSQLGSVVIMPGRDNVELNISYQNENNQNLAIKVVKINGRWELDSPATGIILDPNTGRVTLPADQVLDGSKVSVKGIDIANNSKVVSIIADNQDRVADEPFIEAGNQLGSAVVSPGNDNISVTVSYTDENNNPVTLNAVKNGNLWSFTSAVPSGVTLEPSTGKITLPAEQLKDNSPLTAVGEDEFNNTSSKTYTPVAGDTTADAPALSADDDEVGAINITPGGDNTKVEVNYTREKGLTEGKVVVEKTEEGWKITEQPENASITVDSKTGNIHIPANEVKDGEKVIARGTDIVGNVAESSDNFSAPSDKPSDPARIRPGKETTTIIPGSDNVEVKVDYLDRDGHPQTISIVKENDTWKIVNNTSPDSVAKFNEDNGVLVIKPKPHTDVTVTTKNHIGIDASTSESNPIRDPDPVDAPELERGEKPGSVDVTPGQNNQKLIIDFTNEHNKPVTVVLTKDADGTWSIKEPTPIPEGVVLKDPVTGKVTLEPNALLDRSEITVTGIDGKNNDTIIVSEAGPNSIVGEDDVSDPVSLKAGENPGSVSIKPGEDNVELEIKFLDEERIEKTVIAKKDNGVWKLEGNPDDIEIDPNTGAITINPNAVLDDSSVTVISKNGVGDNATITGNVAGKDEQADAPSVKVGPKAGSILITPGDNNNELVVKFTDEENNEIYVVAKKDSNNNWAFTDDVPDGVSIDSTTGIISIEPNAILDHSALSVLGKNNVGKHVGIEILANTLVGADEKSDSATINKGEEPGSVVVTPGENNTKLEIKYTDDAGKPITIVAEKNPDTGNWAINEPNPLPEGVSITNDGKVEIEPSAILNGSKVEVIASNGSGEDTVLSLPEGNPITGGAKPADLPTVGTDDNGNITVNPGNDNNQVGIVVTKPDGNKEEIKVIKDDKGWHADGEHTGVTVDPKTGTVTIDKGTIAGNIETTGSNGGGHDSSSSTTVPTENSTGSPLVQPSENPGGVNIKPGEGNTGLTVKYTDENNTPKEIHTKVDDDGKWHLVDSSGSPISPPTGVQIDEATGEIKIDPNEILDGSQLSAIGTANGKDSSTVSTLPGTIGNDDPADAPILKVGEDAGSVLIIPGKDNNEVVIGYMVEDKAVTEMKYLTAKKDNNNKWSIANKPNDVEINPDTGVVTLTPNAVRDNSTVSATGKNGLGKDTTVSASIAGEDQQADSPIVARVGKDVIITPGADNIEMKVKYIDEDDVAISITLTKNLATGEWSVTDQPVGVSLLPIYNKNTGAVTLKPNMTKDNSELTVIGHNGKGKDSIVVSYETDSVIGDDNNADASEIAAGDEPGSVAVTPGNDNDELVIQYTDEEGNDVVLIVARDKEYDETTGEYTLGNWKLLTDVPEGAVTVDPNTGKVTIHPDAIKDGSSVIVTSKNHIGANTTIAGDNPAGADKVADAPVIKSGTLKGSAVITPGNDNKEMDVTFTDEGKEEHTITVVKKADDTWAFKDGSEIPEGVMIDPANGTVYLEPNAILDGSGLSATGKNFTGADTKVSTPENNSVIGYDEPADKPIIEVDNDGSATVSPKDGSNNTTIVAEFTDEHNEAQTVTIKKGDNGWTAESELPAGVEVDSNTGKITIKPNAIIDGGKITATGKNGYGEDGVEEKDTIDPADAPIVKKGTEQGSIVVVHGDDNTSEEITFTPEGATDPITITASKDAEGKWTLDNTPAGVTIDPNKGTVTFAPEAIADGKPVTVVGKNGKGADATGNTDVSADAAKAAVQPHIVPGEEAGSVKVTPGDDNKELAVTFTDENDQKVELTLTKDPATGTWAIEPQPPEGVNFDPATGTVNISPNAIKDGSPVNAIGKNGKGEGTDTEVEPAFVAGVDKPADDPFITPKADGSVEIKKGNDNTEIEVNYTTEDPDNPNGKVIARQNDEGKWEIVTKPDNATVTVTPDGTIILAPNDVQDGSAVTATGKNGLGADTTVAPVYATNDAAAATPEIFANDDGSITAKPGDGNNKFSITYTPEEPTDAEPIVLVIEKGDAGWAITSEPKPNATDVEVNSDTGEVTLSPNAVKDESTVSIKASNGLGEDQEKSVNAKEDSPSKTPEISAGTEAGSVMVKPGDDNKVIEITYTTEDSANPDGKISASRKPNEAGELKWSLDKAVDGVSIDESTGVITLSPNAVKDGTTVNATGKNLEGKPAEAAPFTSGNDAVANSPTVKYDFTGEEAGKVQITPATDNTQISVQYTPEGQTVPKTIVAKKVDNVWTIEDKPADVEIDSVTGVITLNPNALKDSTPVTVSANNGLGDDVVLPVFTAPIDKAADHVIIKGDVKKATTPNGPQPADDFTGTEAGKLEITPGADNKEIVVRFTPENSDNPVEMTVVKNDQGVWEAKPGTTLPTGVTVSAGNIVLAPNAVEDHTLVTVTSKNGLGDDYTTTVTALQDKKADSATIDNQTGTQGEVVITPGADNTEMVLTYKPESDQNSPKTLTVTKQDNAYTINEKPDGVTFDEATGKVTLSPNSVMDGTDVNVVTKNGMGEDSVFVKKAGADKPADAPKPVAGQNDSVDVEKGADNIEVEVTYVDTNNEEKIVTARLNNGSWSIVEPNPSADITIDANTGKIHLPRSVLNANTTLHSVGKNGLGLDTASQPYTIGSPTAANPPTAEENSSEKGSVVVKPGENNIELTVKFTDEEGADQHATIVKKGSTWSAKGKLPAGVSFDTNTGHITLSANSVADGSEVNATGKNASGVTADLANPLVAPDDKPADKPDLMLLSGTQYGDLQGGIKVTPGNDNIKIDISYYPEDLDRNLDPKHLIAVKKDNKWMIEGKIPTGVTIDADSGLITFMPDAIQDGSDIYVVSHNGIGAPNQELHDYAGADDPADMPTAEYTGRGFTGENQGKVVVKPSTDNIALKVVYTPEGNGATERTITATKDKATKTWSLDDTPEGVSIDANTGAITFMPNALKDGSKLDVIAQNGIGADTKLRPAITVPDDKPADKATIAQGDSKGSITVMPGADNKEVKVTYKAEDTGNDVTLLMTKGSDNTWKVNPKPQGVEIDPVSGKLTIGALAVKDNTEVNAVSNNHLGAESNATPQTAGENPNATAPTYENNFTGNDAGKVEITPGLDNNAIEVTYIPENSTEMKTVTVNKVGNNWEVANAAEHAGVRVESGKIILEPNATKDGSNIVVKGKNGIGQDAVVNITAGTDAPANEPTVNNSFTGADAGKVEVAPGANNTEMTVRYTPEEGADKTATVLKVGSRWILQNPSEHPYLTVKNGVLIMSPNSIKDGSNFTVTGKNGLGQDAEITKMAGNDKPADQPTVQTQFSGLDTGKVIVTAGADNTELAVRYTPESANATETTLELVKNNGTWQPKTGNLPAEITIVGNTITFSPNATKDNSNFSVTAKNNLGADTTSTPATTGVDKPADQPTITPAGNGAVTIAPGADNNALTFSYETENGVKNTLTATKGANNRWSILNKPADISINDTTGAITLTPDSVKDGSQVTAIGKNGFGTDTAATPKNAGNDTPAVAPTITAGTEAGSVVVTPGAGNTKQVITFTGEDDQEKTVTATKVGNAWAITGDTTNVTVDPTNGKVTLLPNAVQDNTPVNAVGSNGIGADSHATPVDAGVDAPADKATVKTKFTGTEQGQVEVEPGLNNTAMVVNFTAEDNRVKTVTATKSGDSWTLSPNVAGVSINTVTGKVIITPNAIKDGSQITVTTKNNVGADTVLMPKPTAEADLPADHPIVNTNFSGADSGKVEIIPGANNTALELKYLDENDTQKVVKLEKNKTTGKWVKTADTTLAEGVSIVGDKLVLAPNAVKDQSVIDVTGKNGLGLDAKSVDPNNQETRILAGIDKRADQPKIESTGAAFTGVNQGGHVIKPGSDNVRLTVNYTDETANDTTPDIVIQKGSNQLWTVAPGSTLPAGVSLNSSNGYLTFSPNNVKDNTLITATGDNGLGVSNSIAQNAAVDKPAVQAVFNTAFTGSDSGKMVIGVGDQTNNRMVVSYTNERNENKTVTVAKTGANWAAVGAVEAGVSVNRTTGEVTLAPSAVKDGSDVKAVTSNGLGVDATASGRVGNNNVPPTPRVEIQDGSDNVLSSRDLNNGKASVTITFNQADKAKLAVGDKVEVTLPGQNAPHVETLDVAKIRDGFSLTFTPQTGNNTVSAVVKDKSGNASATATDSSSLDLDAPPTPTVTISDGNDAILNVGELNAQGLGVARITFVGSGFSAGDVIEVTKPDNSIERFTLTNAIINAGKEITFVPVAGKANTVTAKATDAHGNVNTHVGSDTTQLDPADQVTFNTQFSGDETGKVEMMVGADNKKVTLNYTDEQNQSQQFVIEKGTNNQWSVTSGNKPNDVTLDPATGKLSFAPNAVKDGEQISAVSSNKLGTDTTTNIDAPLDWTIEKLVLSLNSDTGRNKSDNITNDGKIMVEKVPEGLEWEYSLDDGKTWHAGEQNAEQDGRYSFRLPDNHQEYGIRYSLKARLKGHEESTSDALSMRHDMTLNKPKFALQYDNGWKIVGEIEKGAAMNYSSGRTKNSSIRVNSDGTFEKYIDFDGGSLSMKMTDLAGNHQDATVRFGEVVKKRQLRDANLYGAINTSSGNDIVIVDKNIPDGHGANGPLVAGHLSDGAKVNTGAGDDILYVSNSIGNRVEVNMGSGNDYAFINKGIYNNIASKIYMGDGDDVLVLNQAREARDNYVRMPNSVVDLGSGDDVLILGAPGEKLSNGGIKDTNSTVTGGFGYDKLVIRSSGLNLSDSSLMQNFTGFEEIDIRGSGSNQIRVMKGWVQHNYSPAGHTDDSGKHHNNVLIIRADADDKVLLYDTQTRKAVIRYEDESYSVYDYGHIEVWVNSVATTTYV